MADIDPKTLKESVSVELKEQFNDAALKTLAAFVNTRGGSLYIGVKDDATILSEGITDFIQQNVINRTINILGIIPEVILHKFKNRDFLEIRVKSQRPPVSVRGKYYQRVGNTTREVSGEELKQLFLDGESWDANTASHFTLDQINTNSVRDFIQSAKNEGRIPDDSINQDWSQVLERLGLMVERQLTNAAVLMFGHNPQRYFPNAVVKIGRFRNETTIVADRIISGNIFQQINEAEEQIKSLISRRYEIADDSFFRRDIWQYPLAAIREALLNAVVHRNYLELGVKIQIKIFDDFIWIYSPGKLPGPLTINDLKKPHSSFPRNKLLANIFYRSGLIEEWGSGIQRMMTAMNKENLPEPEFEEMGGGFVVKLFSDYQVHAKQILNIEFNDRQKLILQYAKKGEFKLSDIYPRFEGIHKRTLRRELNKLVNAGILCSKGEKRGRTYKLR